MARFSDLSPELLREIAAHIPISEYERLWREWPQGYSELKSLALVNERCRDAAYVVLYNEVHVSCNEDAEELTARPHICTLIRGLTWEKKRRNYGDDDEFDTEEETEILVALLRKTKHLERLSIRHREDFRVVAVPALSRLHLPRLHTLRTSEHVAPLLSCCPNLRLVALSREYTPEHASVLVSRLGPAVTSLFIQVKRLSVPLLHTVAKLKRLEKLDISTRIPHRDPWGGVAPAVLGKNLARILRPLQKLRVLSLGIAVCAPVDMEEGNPDREEEDAIDHRLAASPIAVALPKLEKISWMFMREDMTYLCGLTGDEEEEEESDASSDDNSTRRYRDSNDITGSVVRKNGRVVVGFGENMPESDLERNYGEDYPHLF